MITNNGELLLKLDYLITPSFNFTTKILKSSHFGLLYINNSLKIYKLLDEKRAIFQTKKELELADIAFTKTPPLET